MKNKRKTMKSFDVVIIGAGLAGLQCAKLLAHENVKTLLVERKDDLTKGIHTTGIFVRKTFEDFDFPPQTLGKPIRDVTLYSPRLKSFEMKSDKVEFRVGRMGVLYKSLLQSCIDSGVEFFKGTRYVSSRITTVDDFEKEWRTNIVSGSKCIKDNHVAAISCADSKTIINLEKYGVLTQVAATVLIGADGTRSRVAKDLNLDKNREWIVGYEEIYRGGPLVSDPRLHCFLDAKLAPGYLAWITNDGEESHIGVGGYPSGFNPRKALKQFTKEVAPKFIDLKKAQLSETRGGRIPVGGVLKRIANKNGLLIGDAAGAVSPLTAGGLDPCMRLSEFASEIVLGRIRTGDTNVLLKYSGDLFRRKFKTRLLMRSLLKSFSYQPLLEIAFKLLRAKTGRKIAEKIFFGRGSFPDVEAAINAHTFVAGNR